MCTWCVGVDVCIFFCLFDGFRCSEAKCRTSFYSGVSIFEVCKIDICVYFLGYFHEVFITENFMTCKYFCEIPNRIIRYPQIHNRNHHRAKLGQQDTSTGKHMQRITQGRVHSRPTDLPNVSTCYAQGLGKHTDVHFAPDAAC